MPYSSRATRTSIHLTRLVPAHPAPHIDGAITPQTFVPDNSRRRRALSEPAPRRLLRARRSSRYPLFRRSAQETLLQPAFLAAWLQTLLQTPKGRDSLNSRPSEGH